MGCTHFLFIKKILQKVANNNPIFIDNGMLTAKKCYEYLNENNLINNDKLEINIIDTNINNKREESYRKMLEQNEINFL